MLLWLINTAWKECPCPLHSRVSVEGWRVGGGRRRHWVLVLDAPLSLVPTSEKWRRRHFHRCWGLMQKDVHGALDTRAESAGRARLVGEESVQCVGRVQGTDRQRSFLGGSGAF